MRPLAALHARTLSSKAANAASLNARLSASTDPELWAILGRETERQRASVALIASENFAPRRVLDCLGTVMSNKYSEGYPGARYYAGNEHIDECELLCQKRALAAFGLDPKVWGVNVQSLSGSPANFQTYSALLKPHDRIMGLDLPHGGHLTHGFFTAKKKISATSIFFESMPYRLTEQTGLIDFDTLDRNAGLFRPNLIIAGTSAYSRLLDYARFRKICDAHGAILMADMAHISGLVSAGVIPSPFEHADVVTTTTHKSLRGPRGAMIFYRRVDKDGKPVDFGERIDFSVFPSMQGGPHNHTIMAMAAALGMCATEDYRVYQKQVLANAKALCGELIKRGFSIVSGGTDNHLMLVDVKKTHGIDGARAERVMELVALIANKNTVPTDKSALVPSGIRVGTPAFTSRGATEADFVTIAGMFEEAIVLAQRLASDKRLTGTKLADFKAFLAVSPDSDEFKKRFPEVAALRSKVQAFAKSFPGVGFE